MKTGRTRGSSSPDTRSLIAKTWHDVRGRRLILAAIAAIGIAALGLLLYAPNAPIERTLSIGFRNSEPDHFPDASGNATGPVVEVVKEAARRTNIKLKWVYSPKGPEEALADGSVELWPILGDTPERRKTLYISSPWMRRRYVLVLPDLAPLRPQMT